jgi:hypothetical protein
VAREVFVGALCSEMKRTKEVVDLTGEDEEDEIKVKPQGAFQSQSKKKRRKRIGLKENDEKFLNRSFYDSHFRRRKEDKLHNFHNFEKMAAAAAAISHQYAEQLLESHVGDIQVLHQALDVEHTHIPCGDSSIWNQLPNGFKNHFISSQCTNSLLILMIHRSETSCGWRL